MNKIANELIHGDFVFVWTTPDGFQYCPFQQTAMVLYLRVMKHLFIKNDDNLLNLRKILSHSAMNWDRRAMVEIAMAKVFPCGLSESLSERLKRTNQVNLSELISKLDMCVDQFELPPSSLPG